MDWKRCFSGLLVCWPLGLLADIHVINSIKDLDNKGFGQNFPQHGLMLLYWFASIIDIDQNDIVRFKEQHFDVTTGYPFSMYPNDNHFLPDLEPTTSYYSAGNFLEGTAHRFPTYVTQDFYNSFNFPTRNRDRIILRVDKWYDPVRIDRIYIARESNYAKAAPSVPTADPPPPYQITVNLLRQIISLSKTPHREIHPNTNQSLTIAENMFSEPGLARFLTTAGYDLRSRYGVSVKMWSCPNMPPAQSAENLCTTGAVEMTLTTAQKGHAIVSWSGLPNSIQTMHSKLALFKSCDGKVPLTEVRVNGRLSGSAETSVPLNPGLQIRLLKEEVGDTLIWRSHEFDDAAGRIPAAVRGGEASFQLFTKDGYAAARLYVRRSFTQWREDFYYSWVGFYSGPSEDMEDYLDYQWAVSFRKQPSGEFEDFDVYEYESWMYIVPGIQLRFFLKEEEVVAQTETWA
ncbi:uncharacterized protein LOC114787877 [Denticeps clupeoides]|uniref:uncharacterized protein LOC114787877 n=1 Tax=Denticeps clupeoides TaxID=299321 RepID=UPI0010A3AA41|nr:uncharacterized protein LOC114787877 [Denticeps clupeoides]